MKKNINYLDMPNDKGKNQNGKPKEKEPSIFLASIYYFYFALLPFLSFALLYLEDDAWHQFTTFIDYNTSPSSFFFYHLYSPVMFAYSAVFAVFIIGNSSFPKNFLFGLILVFDTPLVLFIDYINGNSFSIAELVITDFTFQIAAFLIASNLLFFIKKQNFLNDKPFTLHFLSIVTIFVLFSYYGTLTLNMLKTSSPESLVSFAFAFFLTVVGYYNILESKKKNEEIEKTKLGKVRGTMIYITSLAVFLTWGFIAYAYIKTLLF